MSRQHVAADDTWPPRPSVRNSRTTAVGHYQFEAIHPFTDANGRTGRILNLLFLVEQELLRLPVWLYTYELVELLFTQPYCRIADVVDAGIAKRQAADRAADGGNARSARIRAGADNSVRRS